LLCLLWFAGDRGVVQEAVVGVWIKPLVPGTLAEKQHCGDGREGLADGRAAEELLAQGAVGGRGHVYGLNME
jgi:hypothetical protein